MEINTLEFCGWMAASVPSLIHKKIVSAKVVQVLHETDSNYKLKEYERKGIEFNLTEK
ncbi:hypothetical protein [Floccifex sp.]|uniref:hypothetical protein n=1 Tax=Floccifex sp. TaxID=2815810 RepID=UPI003F0CD99D